MASPKPQSDKKAAKAARAIQRAIKNNNPAKEPPTVGKPIIIDPPDVAKPSIDDPGKKPSE
jgi:hypothetical protein